MHESLEPKMKESEQQNTVDTSCGENHNDVADACQIGNREGYEVMENATIWPNNWLTPSPITPWFGREAPLHVDLGFGLGGFLCQMAAQHPEINFLGIERQLERMRKIDRRVAFRKLDNVRLMRIEAGYYLTYMLPEASVDVLYILFPDPWPKLRHQHERLLGPGFIDAIHRSLKPDGVFISQPTTCPTFILPPNWWKPIHASYKSVIGGPKPIRPKPISNGSLKHGNPSVAIHLGKQTGKNQFGRKRMVRKPGIIGMPYLSNRPV